MNSRLVPAIALTLALPLAAAATLAMSAADVSAAPKPAAKKASPTKKKPAKLAITPALADKLKRIGPTSAMKKTQLLRKAGIAIDPGELKAPTRLSVRQPWIDATTALAFLQPQAVVPRDGEGLVFFPAGMMVPTGIDILGLLQGEDGITGALPTNALAVQFRAAANTHYIVDCKYSDGGDFATAISIGTAMTSGTPDAGDGHVIQFVRAATSRRDIVVHFLSDAPWVGSSCEITPVG